MGDFPVRDFDLLGNTRHQVPAVDRRILRRVVQFVERGANQDLDLFGGALSDEDIMLPFHVADDVAGQFVAGNPDRLIANDAG